MCQPYLIPLYGTGRRVLQVKPDSKSNTTNTKTSTPIEEPEEQFCNDAAAQDDGEADNQQHIKSLAHRKHVRKLATSQM